MVDPTQREGDRRMTRGPYLGRGIFGILAIVAFGVAVADSDITRFPSAAEASVTRASRLHAGVFLGRQEYRIATDTFRAGDVSALMGRVDVDLRAAEMAGDEAVLELAVLMGHVELRIPEQWTVVTDLGAALTDVDVRTSPLAADDGAPRLLLRGGVLMGSIAVRN